MCKPRYAAWPPQASEPQRDTRSCPPAAHAPQTGPLNLAAAVVAAQQDGEARRLLCKADALLARLAAGLPPNCLLLVLSGQGNNALARVLHGEGSRRKDGVEAANRRREAAKASVPVQQLAQRAQQGALLALWSASGAS